ncbi:MAG: restriction endonuclease [bacterium]
MLKNKSSLKPWQEYEKTVYDLFRSTGHRCQRDVIMPGARGSHQIDIVVSLSEPIGHHQWLVECKHWQRPVGKRDVHSFKTVIDDIGADHGYLLSEKGFQKGATEMARMLNISLYTLSELRELFIQEQLTPQYQQSKAFRVAIDQEDDKGNMDSMAILELVPVKDVSVTDHVIEIHVIRENILNWIISTDSVQKLITKDGRLIIRLPWDPISLCGVELDTSKRGGLTSKTKAGVTIDGPYRVVFRTLAGPISVKTFVPGFY